MKISLARASYLSLAATTLAASALAIAPMGGGNAATKVPERPRGGVINVRVDALPLTVVGHVNLSAIASAEHRSRPATKRQGAPIPKSAATRA